MKYQSAKFIEVHLTTVKRTDLDKSFLIKEDSLKEFFEKTRKTGLDVLENQMGNFRKAPT